MRVLFNALATFSLGSGLVGLLYAVLPALNAAPAVILTRAAVLYPAAGAIIVALLFLAVSAALKRLEDISRSARDTADAMLAIARTAETTP